MARPKVEVPRTGEERDLIIQEFTEAWNHYRHIESARAKHLGIFFAVFAASLGICATLLKTQGLDNPLMISTALFILLLVDTLSVVTYLIARKSKFLLEHYERIVEHVRNIVYARPEDMRSLFDIRRDAWFAQVKEVGIQTVTERLLLGAGIVVNAIQISLVCIHWKGDLLRPSVGPFIVIAVIAIVYVKVKAWRRVHPKSLPEPPVVSRTAE